MKGILFSPEMAAAIRNGNKTMTRRLMKPQPDQAGYVCPEFKVPYSKGDIFYIREEHYAYGVWQPNGFTEGGRKKWKFKTTGAHYFADEKETYPTAYSNKFRKEGWYKRMARYMPKSYARTFIKVTEIRAEKLIDITDEDALREGIEYSSSYTPQPPDGELPPLPWRNYMTGAAGAVLRPVDSFLTLWESINGDAWRTWTIWVYVVTFEQISKPL